MNEKEKIEIFHKIREKISNKFEFVDTRKSVILPGIVDLYTVRVTQGVSLNNIFFDLLNSKGEDFDKNIGHIKTILFLSGILFAKENPEIFETLHDNKDYLEMSKKSELISLVDEDSEVHG